MTTYTLSTGDVSRAIERSVERVRSLDAALRPIRLANGHRRYDPAVVEQYLAARSGERP